MMRDKFGRVAMLHSSATQWQHRFMLDIALTEGGFELHGILTGSKSYGEETLIIRKRDESDKGTLQFNKIQYLEDNSWRDEINEFAEVVLNGGEILHGTSAEALATMKLVFRIYGADERWQKTNNIQLNS
jgi:predicted dehydrogenase